MVNLNPYLSFRTETREALEFYRTALGGTVEVMPFGDMPMPDLPQGAENLVMHGSLTTEHGLTLMAADSPEGMMPYEAPSGGVTVALTGGSADREYIAAAYEKLSEGASDVLPFEPAPWGDVYGSLKDKYGVSWMFDCGTPESEAAAAQAGQQG
ncbi:VOC family protein [Myceligenerans crystallogenes]|uniref:VOC family protein n=1 Tax=Myceligenerans crystallogenes TaxID=316335 RepID=A0ABP4ZLA0_9MICO